MARAVTKRNIAWCFPDAGSAERPRVLLADDHPGVLALTADVLASECLVVGSVGDGRDLVAEAERLDPDVIVLDITMPRLDGIESARRLRYSHRPLRFQSCNTARGSGRTEIEGCGRNG